jgi:hypothetical protein
LQAPDADEEITSKPEDGAESFSLLGLARHFFQRQMRAAKGMCLSFSNPGTKADLYAGKRIVPWGFISERKNLMNTLAIIISVVIVLVVLGGLLAVVFARRQRSEKFHAQFGAEYDRTVESLGTEKKAQKDLNERRKHVETLKIHPLSAQQREHYRGDWKTVQAKFVDEPGQAVVEADRLIMEVMQARAYPVSDFEQRAADLSVQYPALVSNYRAARAIALKNKNQQADTETLRQGVMYYRSLFDELLKGET